VAVLLGVGLNSEGVFDGAAKLAVWTTSWQAAVAEVLPG
jgi:hypothetical protein